MHKALVCLCVVMICPLATAIARDPVDKAVPVESDDAEMTAAIDKARGLLPHFWQTLDKPQRGEQGFALKVRMTDGSDVEHFWLTPVERKDGRIFGTINNDPNTVKSVALGQRVEVPEADITDWLYIRDDMMIGNYTLRAMFKAMPPAQVRALKKRLGDP